MKLSRHARFLLILAAVICLVAQPDAVNNKYGMVTHYVDSNIANKMVELGAGIVRVDFNWNEIEGSCKGCFNWDTVAAWVNAAQSRGLAVFATLAYTPAWANGGAGPNVPPTNYDDWYDFVRATALRFSGFIYYGAWNEPNLTGFLAGSRAQQLAAYGQLALRARDALNSVNPALPLVGPEVNHDGIDDGFYRTVMQDYGHSVFNIVSVHIYKSANEVRIKMNGEVRDWAYGKDMWLTEVGAWACDGESGEASQWIYYRDILNNAWFNRAPEWKKIFFYHLYDGQTCGDAIVRWNWTNRTAFVEYQDFIRFHP